MDSKDPVTRSLDRYLCSALSVNYDDRFILACDVGVMTSPFAICTYGPKAGLTLLHKDIPSSYLHWK